MHLRFKSAATPGRSETCGCVALCQPAVCVFLNMCLYVCVFSYPHLYRRHSAAPLTPDYLFCSPILSHFVPLWQACSLHCGHTFDTSAATLGLKVERTHFHTRTHMGRPARTHTDSRTYAVLLPPHGKAHVSSFTCSQM